MSLVLQTLAREFRRSRRPQARRGSTLAISEEAPVVRPGPGHVRLPGAARGSQRAAVRRRRLLRDGRPCLAPPACSARPGHVLFLPDLGLQLGTCSYSTVQDGIGLQVIRETTSASPDIIIPLYIATRTQRIPQLVCLRKNPLHDRRGQDGN